MRTVKRVAKNSLMIVLSTIVTKILSLIFIIFIARYLGDVGFGKYSFVFALLSFFTVFTTFGMDLLIVREVAKDKSKSNAFLLNSAVLKSFLNLIAWVILGLLIVALKKDLKVNLGILIIGLGLLPDSLIGSFKAIFSAHEKMEYNTLIDILLRIVIVGLGLSVIFFDFGLIPLFLVSLLATLISLLISICIYINKIGGIKIEINFALLRYFIKTSYAFGLIGIFVAIYHRVDTVMLSIMKGDAPVGWYSAAYRLTESFLFVPTAICLAVFPVLSKLYNESKKSFNRTYQKSFKFLLLLALPIGVGITLLANKIIPLIYTPEFNNSIIAFRILIWAAALVFLNSIMGFAIYSANKQKMAFITAGSMIFVNVILNYLFIPKYSYIAASWTTVVTEILVFICYYSFISNYIYRVGIIQLLLKPLLAVMVMGIFIYQLRSLNLSVLILLGMLIYFIVLLILKTFSPEDKRIFRELVSFGK